MEWHYFWVVIVLTFSKAVVHLTAPLSENDCPFNEFKCITKHGRVCLSNNWKCDGTADCEDALDEQNCTACNPSLWACHCSNPAKLACIHPSWRCDGMIECDDKSDEMDCDKKVEEEKVTAPLSENDCSFNEFKCITKNGRVCLSNNCKCDGRANCEDALDEQNCTACNPSLWACHSSSQAKLECIHPSWRCDGTIECDDGSDEMDCDKKVEEEKVTGSPMQLRMDAKVHPPMTGKPDPISGNMNSDLKMAPKMTDYPTDYSPRRRYESNVEVELIACFSVLGLLMVAVTIALVFVYRRHREILCAIFKQPITRQRSTPSNSVVMNDVHIGVQIREETTLLEEHTEMSVNEQRKRQLSITTQSGKEMSQHQPTDDYFPEMAEHDLDEFKKLEENRLGSAVLDRFIPAGYVTHRIDIRYHMYYEDTEVNESATDCDMDLDQVEERETVEEKRKPDTVPEEKLPRSSGIFNSLERIPKNSKACNYAY